MDLYIDVLVDLETNIYVYSIKMSVSTFLMDGPNASDQLFRSNITSYITFGTDDYEIETVMAIDIANTTAGTQPFSVRDLKLIIPTITSTDVVFQISFGSFGPTRSITVPLSEVDNQFIKLKVARVTGTTTVTVDTNTQSRSSNGPSSYDIDSAYNGFWLGLSTFTANFAYFKVTTNEVKFLMEPNSITGPLAEANIISYSHNGSSTTSRTPFPYTVENISGVIPCFGEGTQILTIENDEEIYVAVEKLVEGSVVKTYKHGARKIAKIVSGSFINDPQEPKRCMYKLPKTDAMTNDLMLTGGHAVLVDESPKGLQFKIDDKYLSFAENNADFVKIDNHQIYKYYNFSMENDGDKDRRFGVWANGVLCETPSEKQLESFEL